MGIDPNEDLYTEAEFPGFCELLLFDGRTPKFIEVHVSGIILCPVATTPDPNGTYVLTQFNSTIWTYSDADRTVQLELRPGFSFFAIFGHPGLQSLFQDTKGLCVDIFQNDQVDCTPPNAGHSGGVNGYWGPGISV